MFDEAIPPQPPANKKPGAEITITLRRIHLYAILLPLIFLLGLGSGYLFWGRGAAASPADGTTGAGAANSPAQSAASDSGGTGQIQRYEVSVDDDPIIGPENAPITVIEFSDYECPYCQKWQNEVYGKLLEEYPDQVRLVYRDFPLSSIHPNALPAALAANCANEQGQYWQFHDRLFSMELGLDDKAYEAYATQLGMNVQSFLECYKSGRYEEEIQADYDFASQLGVRSTPTFFINGIAIVGAQPFEVFKQVIDKELAGEIP